MTPNPILETIPRSYEEYRQRRDRMGPGTLDEEGYSDIMFWLKQETGLIEQTLPPNDAALEIANLNHMALARLGLVRETTGSYLGLGGPLIFDITDHRLPNSAKSDRQALSDDVYPSSIKVNIENRFLDNFPSDHALIAFGQFGDGRDFVIHRIEDDSDPQQIVEVTRADISNGGLLMSHPTRVFRSPNELSVFIATIGVIIIPHNSDLAEFIPDGIGSPLPIPRFHRKAANLD